MSAGEISILKNVLLNNPDLLGVDSFLDTILSKVSFQQFVSELISFPQIYDDVTKKQDYWKKYYLKDLSINNPADPSRISSEDKTLNNPADPSRISSEDKTLNNPADPSRISSEDKTLNDISNDISTNWFYEIFKTKDYYYNYSSEYNTLTTLLPNFQPSDELKDNFNNKLPFNNLKDVFLLGEETLFLSQNDELYSYGIDIDYENNTSNKNFKLIIQNVKKVIFRYSSEFYQYASVLLILDKKGDIYRYGPIQIDNREKKMQYELQLINQFSFKELKGYFVSDIKPIKNDADRFAVIIKMDISPRFLLLICHVNDIGNMIIVSPITVELLYFDFRYDVWKLYDNHYMVVHCEPYYIVDDNGNTITNKNIMKFTKESQDLNELGGEIYKTGLIFHFANLLKHFTLSAPLVIDVKQLDLYKFKYINNKLQIIDVNNNYYMIDIDMLTENALNRLFNYDSYGKIFADFIISQLTTNVLKEKLFKITDIEYRDDAYPNERRFNISEEFPKFDFNADDIVNEAIDEMYDVDLNANNSKIKQIVVQTIDEDINYSNEIYIIGEDDNVFRWRRDTYYHSITNITDVPSIKYTIPNISRIFITPLFNLYSGVVIETATNGYVIIHNAHYLYHNLQMNIANEAWSSDKKSVIYTLRNEKYIFTATFV